MGWNQCHCKDYQILSPATIHELKLDLERPRYHENQDNALIDASLTSKSHNFWSDRWIFKFHTFSETRSQDFSRGSKINSIRDLLKVAALEEPSPRKAWRGYKRPQAPFKPKKKSLLGSYSLPGWILSFFSLSLKHKSTKNTSKPLDSSLFTKNTRYCSYTQSSFSWLFTLDLWFRGVDVAF